MVLFTVGPAACSSSSPNGDAPNPTTDAGPPVADDASPDPTTEDHGALAFTGPDPAARFAIFEDALRKTARLSPEAQARLGTTFDAEVARARARFIAARTPLDVYYAILSLKNSMHDAHATFFHDPSLALHDMPAALLPTTPPVTLPLTVRVEYDSADSATEAPSYLLEGSGIPAGSVLETIDGIPVADLPDQLREWFPFHVTEGLHEFIGHWLTERFAENTPAPAPGTTAELSFHSGAPSGPIAKATLTWKAAKGGGPPPPCCEMFGTAEARRDYQSRTPTKSGANYCVYDATGSTPASTIAIVRWCSFDYERPSGLEDDEASLSAHLSKSPPAHVLFDVRENGGGTFDPAYFAAFTTASYRIPTKALYFAPAFREDPSALDRIQYYLEPLADPAGKMRADMAAHPTATFSSERPFFCRTATCSEAEATEAGGATAPTFTTAILTGPLCLSACDDFVSIMRDNGLATLVGTPSAGADSPYRYPVSLPLAKGSVDLEVTVGVSYRPTPGHEILEGHSPAVDKIVRQAASNRADYLGSVITALGW